MTTTVVASVSTDQANGTLYGVIVNRGDAPSNAQIKAGQQASGATAPGHATKSVTAEGLQTLPPMTGLTEGGDYDVEIIHTNSGGVDSDTLIQEFTAESAGAVAPILSAATAAAVSATTVTPRVTTTGSDGVLYTVVVPNGDSPSVAQIIAGQQSSGAAAIAAGSLAVTASGIQTMSLLSGLTGGTTYVLQYVHRAASLLDSNIAFHSFTSSAITPLITAGPTYTPDVSPPEVEVTLTSDQSGIATVEFIQAWTAGQVWPAPSGTAADCVMPITYSGRTFQRMVAGTSHATTQPAAFTTAALNDLVADNGVAGAWKCIAAAAAPSPIYAFSLSEAAPVMSHSLTLDDSDGMTPGYLYHARARVQATVGGLYSAWTSDGTFTVAAAFTPASLANLWGWWKKGAWTPSAGRVATWQDHSGASRHLVNADSGGAFRPTDQTAYARFVAASFLSLNTGAQTLPSHPLSMWVRCRPTAWVSGQSIISGFAARADVLQSGTTPALVGYNGLTGFGPINPTLNTWIDLFAVFAAAGAATTFIRYNNSAPVFVDLVIDQAAAGGITIGANFGPGGWADVDIMELAVYTRLLSQADCDNLHIYGAALGSPT